MSREGKGNFSSAHDEAISRALAQIGEPLEECEAREFYGPEPCECKEGMFPTRPSRRGLLRGVGVSAAAVAAAVVSTDRGNAKAPPGAIEYPVQADPTKEPSRGAGDDGGYGSRSQFETEVRWWSRIRTASYTPLHKSHGIITPSGLHFERHHGGIPNIDPAKHRLVIHGLVDRPLKFSVAELARFPSVSRHYFIECSGQTGSEFNKVVHPTAQRTHGMVSTSEWTGVPLSTLLRQTGLKDGAAWVLAEGADAAVLSRSVPLDKCLSDALIVYAQNGEAIRPEQGYPIRLLLPGWEGNISIKWLRRLEVSDKPFMTRWETSRYSDPIILDGKARQFTFVMEAKSVITFPSGEMRLPGPGFYEVTGLAWSGRGKIARVEVSADAGKTWHLASLQDPVLPLATTRFRFPWIWDGKPAVLQSRATDETGYTQPTHQQIADVRGMVDTSSIGGWIYHMNAIQSWGVLPDGSVKNVHPFDGSLANVLK
jgi:sulfane dehydrogenase subunit SoxC